MDVLADLSARADRCPGVDHRSLVDISADVHIGRHQDHARSQIGAVTGRSVRHDADAEFLVPGLQVQLVVKFHRAGFGHPHPANGEIEDHGLLDPFVDLPPAVAQRFGRAELSTVEQIDRLAYRAFDRLVAEQFAVVPRLLDGRFQIFVHKAIPHGFTSAKLRNLCRNYLRNSPDFRTLRKFSRKSPAKERNLTGLPDFATGETSSAHAKRKARPVAEFSARNLPDVMRSPTSCEEGTEELAAE